MILFTTHQIREAKACAIHGGQALHMMTGEWAEGWGGPNCFRKATEFAHLLDQDADRLKTTAHRLGVRRVKISRRGTPLQHVDLCGQPLRRAKTEALASQEKTNE